MTGSVISSSHVAISPAASAEEAAAIVAALELLWPRPAPAPGHAGPPSKWRFSGRPWQAPARWPAVRYR
ncbi:hypothetical protein [Candidatus Poriferisodalis sp.]|uniref:hypothetical protein n=1 Tax=Candidatus Poriferisodalis sp. TaxID=3101277 RepID=UPI003B5187BF